MWDLFKPPTDNLYKFRALTGILICAASALGVFLYLILMQGWLRRDALQAWEARARLNQAGAAARRLAVDVDLALLELALDKAKTSGGPELARDFERIREVEVNLAKQLELLDESMKEAEMAGALATIDFKLTQRAWSFAPAVLFIAGLSFLLGAGVCTRNFREWQTKVQDPLDRILFSQAALEESSPGPGR